MTSKKFFLTTLIAVGIFLSSIAFGQSTSKQMSKKEKLEDFDTLYKEFQECYPYFGVNLRLNGIDWLSNYKKYKKKIRKTKNDKDFYLALVSILNDLNNDHTDTYPTVIFPYFYSAYKELSEQDKSIVPFVKELEKTDTVKTQRWASINQEIIDNQNKGVTESINNELQTQPNITIEHLANKGIAIIKIRSFSYDLLESDTQTLIDFFSNLDDYQNLVIDIQGNDGGTTEYWSEYIVPYLINDTLAYHYYLSFKFSDKLKTFKPSYFERPIDKENVKLPNLPSELLEDKWGFTLIDQVIIPKRDVKTFEGKIYLLVDGTVFSSAEALAVMFKITKLGLVVGDRTNGDGIGTDPLLLTLPNSGIVIRYTGEMGLNSDGSANEESKTVPDIKIDASSEKERLEKLIKMIKQ